MRRETVRHQTVFMPAEPRLARGPVTVSAWQLTYCTTGICRREAAALAPVLRLLDVQHPTQPIER